MFLKIGVKYTDKMTYKNNKLYYFKCCKYGLIFVTVILTDSKLCVSMEYSVIFSESAYTQ